MNTETGAWFCVRRMATYGQHQDRKDKVHELIEVDHNVGKDGTT